MQIGWTATLTLSFMFGGYVILLGSRQRTGKIGQRIISAMGLSNSALSPREAIVVTVGALLVAAGFITFLLFLFLALPSGSQIGLCLFVGGICATMHTLKRHVQRRGMMHILPSGMKDLLFGQSFLEFWEAPPPPWLIECADVGRTLVLLSVAKRAADRKILLDRIPANLKRRGMLNILPKSLQNIILPPALRNLRSSSARADETSASRIPATSRSVSDRNGSGATSSVRNISMAAILYNQIISDLRKRLLRIPRAPLHLACLISSGVLFARASSLRAPARGMRRMLYTFMSFLSTLSTSGLLALVLARLWAQHTASSDEALGTPTPYSVATLMRYASVEAFRRAYRTIRALLLLCLRRIRGRGARRERSAL